MVQYDDAVPYHALCFSRAVPFRGADPVLGVEMASTGEVACFGVNKEEAFLKVSHFRSSYYLFNWVVLLMSSCSVFGPNLLRFHRGSSTLVFYVSC